MRIGRTYWTGIFAVTLITACNAGPAQADFIPPDPPTLLGEFRAFLNDFSRWDAAHDDLPLIALAITPDAQRGQMLLLLWNLWLRNQPFPLTAFNSLPTSGGMGTQPGGNGGTISSTPGGGTIASAPSGGTSSVGDPGGAIGAGGGGSGSPSGNSPEPSTLALLSCGSLSLLVYRFIRPPSARAA